MEGEIEEEGARAIIPRQEIHAAGHHPVGRVQALLHRPGPGDDRVAVDAVLEVIRILSPGLPAQPRHVVVVKFGADGPVPSEMDITIVQLHGFKPEGIARRVCVQFSHRMRPVAVPREFPRKRHRVIPRNAVHVTDAPVVFGR